MKDTVGKRVRDECRVSEVLMGSAGGRKQDAVWGRFQLPYKIE